MITDPMFYAAALPAIALAGLSKGGFGGAFGFASVPLMALVISPVQAAGLMLPILLVMDAVAVVAYRTSFDKTVVWALLPSALVGIGFGWATASLVSDDAVRIVVGAIALIFLLRVWRDHRRQLAKVKVAPVPAPDPASSQPAPPSPMVPPKRRPDGAALWGTLCGYTSFVAHAGGPPFQAYVVPIGLAPVLYAGTSAIFFAMVNTVKVVPYAALGQFDAENLSTAAVLAPLAILSTLVGVRIVRWIDQRSFYRILIVSVLVVGVKLIWDGVTGIAG